MLCEKGWYVMDWLFWYMLIGLVIGAYGKATSGKYNGPLLAELIALLFFMLGWPLVLIVIFNSHWQFWKRNTR